MSGPKSFIHGQLAHGKRRLAPIANAAPALPGEVLVEVTQFLHPLAGVMSCDADSITGLQKGTFATHIRGVTKRAVPLSFPFFVLEKRPKADAETLATIRDHSRQSYASPWVPPERPEPLGEAPDDAKPDENQDDDPLKPSSEL